ncbi:hypothetical protein PV416_16685 [Streptomyces ipomoeae]|uniref:hypothetical protein n=1 Tax=Streptomyces ipomoeae TaxID=103232 RepID=UPI0011477AE7|nr:hypothetical protein [Streptomyces ipomoeae]MDX2822701.1 hypothetical protein [Streptomyces ipomoeae]MDX2846215.1 hypothetical protein [Streptomyces ipomoeae]MDX2875331.1 hypothetical protein [Streptomyces ipomoeae]TQE35381.1 hypothetical protein Sipo7851_15015 [Streptomyces ipomoeae]
MRKIVKKAASVAAVVAASGALVGVSSTNAAAADANCTASIFQLQRDFNTFDNAAHGGARDGLVSYNDLRAVANGTQQNGTHPSDGSRNAARYLLNHPDQLRRLDTAAQGGSPDERISQNDNAYALAATRVC